MRAEDPTILAAMDGLERPADAATNGKTGRRDDPTAFFFPVFGLVFEALSSQAPDASSTTGTVQMTITALDAMKSLVRPEYSGSAMLESVIFDEVIGLSYRLALTEPAVVQQHLVEMITSLALSQGDRLLKQKAYVLFEVTSPGAHCCSRNGHSTDAFPTDTPLSDCLRICAFVLRHSVPTARSPPGNLPLCAPDCGSHLAGQQGNSLTERISMLNATFTAFNSVSTQFGPAHRETLRAVGITLYSGT